MIYDNPNQVETITAKIYLGLREGYAGKIHSLDELKDFIQEYANKNPICVTITPTTFIYPGGENFEGREEGAIIGLINYPRFPTSKLELESRALEIANLCKKEYKQNRVSIEFQDKTIMLAGISYEDEL